MKIAIVGAGLSGLALSLSLKQANEKSSITIFYSDPVEKIASFISTGLIHPFAGKFAKKSWRADEGIEKSEELFKLSEKYLNRPVFSKGILRIAALPYQKVSYLKVAKKYPENLWYESCKHIHPALDYPALFIPSGMTVFSSLYLQGLYLACRDKGIQFIERKINQLKELKEFDQIILAAGDQLLEYEECKTLPVEKIKGQTLLCKWPSSLPYLPFSIISQGHISICENNEYCYLGSTYERDFLSKEGDDIAYSLKEKIGSFFPQAKEFKVLSINSAVRLCRIDSSIPLVGQIAPKVWVMGAMGSKGLLYHAYLADLLTKSIYSGEKLPKELLVDDFI